jgi:hypothetical protein
VSWRSIAIFIAIVRLLRKLALSTGFQRLFAIFTEIDWDRRFRVRGFGDRSQFSLRSIAGTEGLELSEGFQ